MTTNQKRLRELLDKQSRARQRLAEIARSDDAMTPEVRSEFDVLEGAVPDLERQIRAARMAVEAESEGETGDQSEPDAETREADELRGRARLTNYLLGAAAGTRLSGVEAEYNAAAGIAGDKIPIDLFEVAPPAREVRQDAATPAPATVGLNLDPLRPMIYARAALPRIGVEMPRVGSGTYATATLSTGLTAGAESQGDDAEATAAAFTASTTTPHRVSARLSVQVEDVAAIGVDNFESILRQNLMLALSDRLDHLGLTGDGAGANPQGLISQLTAPSAPSAVITWNGFAQTSAQGIDGGPWAETEMQVMVLCNPETHRQASSTFKDGSGFAGNLSAAAYLREYTGGFFSSRRMPDTASGVAQAIRYRSGTMGLDGVNAMRTAVCPVWAELGIDDIYSGSASGTRFFTLHHLIGDVLVVQPDAYELVAYQLA